MNYGDIRDDLKAIRYQLEQIHDGVNNSLCCGADNIVFSSGGTLAAGFSYVRITQTSTGGTTTIHLANGSELVLSYQGAFFEFPFNGKFKSPAITITGSGGATWNIVAI